MNQTTPAYQRVKDEVDKHRLATVCEEAKCPNIGEYIERVEADYESEYVASLSDEERVRYILVKENPELEGLI